MLQRTLAPYQLLLQLLRGLPSLNRTMATRVLNAVMRRSFTRDRCGLRVFRHLKGARMSADEHSVF